MTNCADTQCDKPIHGRGYCITHYQAAARAGQFISDDDLIRLLEQRWPYVEQWLRERGLVIQAAR